MSSIRTQIGYAEVELSGSSGMRKMSGELRVTWLADDLLQATAAVLTAIGDPRAESVQALLTVTE